MAFTRAHRAGLRRNALDSMRHAFAHFGELDELQGQAAAGPDTLLHHQKWAILSVHHAADCALQLLLDDLDPGNACFVSKGALRHPSLSVTLKQLRCPHNVAKLARSEGALLGLLHGLDVERHALMHRGLSGNLEPSIAAFAMLGLRGVLRARYGIDETDFGWWASDICQEVMRVISLRHYDEYFTYVEQALQEGHPGRWIEACPYCGTHAVLDGAFRCDACFLAIDWAECPLCGTQFPQMANPGPDEPCTCPSCNSAQPPLPSDSCA